MKKNLVLLTAVVASLGLSVSFANAPVLDLENEQSTVALSYALHDNLDGGHVYDATLQHGLSHRLAAEFSHMRASGTEGGSLNRVSGYYAVNRNVNAYVAAGKATDVGLGYQVGVVGHTPLSQRLSGYIQAGVGTKSLHNLIQVGVQYQLSQGLHLDAYYARHAYKAEQETDHYSGIFAGVGYSF